MEIVTKLRFIGVALLVGVFVSVPFALVAEEEKKPSRRERLMQRFDKNKDGKLDEAERESIRKLLSRSWGSGDENATKRDDKIHIPKDYDSKKKYPFILTLHGYTSSGRGQLRFFPLEKLAEKYDFIYCAPDIPFVVDSMKGFKMTAWPGVVVRHWLGRDSKNTWELAGATFSYVDPKNLAGWLECPVLMGVGLQDNAAPAPTAFAAYNQVRGPKAYRIYPEAGHSTPHEHEVGKMAWIRERFALEK